MPENIDDAIRIVAERFALELRQLRDRRQPRDNFSADTLTLTVSVSDHGGMAIEHTHGYGTAVRAADLDTLLDEIYRRAGFAEREAGRLQAASRTLLPIEAAKE